MKKTQTLQFYAEGEGFTELLRSFVYEGSYKIAYDTLKEGGLPDEMIKKFFLWEGHFEGDTITDKGMGFVPVPIRDPKTDYGEILHTGIATALEAYNRTIRYQFTGDNDYDDDNYFEADEFDVYQILTAQYKVPDLAYLIKVVGEQEVLSNLWKEVLRRKGFELATPHIRSLGSGVILATGEYITCEYNQHQYLQPILAAMKLVSSADWAEDTIGIHVSSNQLSGKVAGSIHWLRELNEAKVTEAQLQTLYDFKDQIIGPYGKTRTLCTELLYNIQAQEEFGNKWNNLMYLRKYYKHILTPRISKEPIAGVKNCLRTSPLHSLPGLLESIFDITENSVTEMHAHFEKHKDVIKNNQLNVFYQEFLEGSNGVCHCYEKGDVTYSLSESRGEIVEGKKGTELLEGKLYRQLRKVAEELFTDFNTPVQLEFVVHDNKIYIVQLRLLKNNFSDTVVLNPPDEVIAFGITFSAGTITAEVKDILVVHSEAKSEQLIGKKALIVMNNVEFSHILALSKALHIPSIYATGNFEMPKSGKVTITAQNKEAWIEATP